MGINYNPFSLEGKTIFVTGASSGIGREISVQCSKMGAKLIITGRNEDRLKETMSMLEGANNSYLIADLTDDGAIKDLVASLPILDGVVLCAGKGGTTPILFATPDKFQDIFKTNFFSPIELIRLIVKSKKIKKESSVVNIVSIGGTHSFNPGNSIYGTSKAAYNSMIKFLALEFAPKKIRVNGICPGMVETPLIKPETLTQEQLDIDKDSYLLKRYGKPEDVAYCAIYLLSDASSWVTGQSIIIDGGKTVK